MGTALVKASRSLNAGSLVETGEENMMKSGTTFGLPVLVLGSALGVTAFAQTSATPTQTTNDQPATTSSSTTNPNDTSSYATGKPLQGQSKEGFWGHMNPLARKKWVNRQVDPIKDR